MKNIRSHWLKLIAENLPKKYKGWPRQVSLRMKNDESYWNGYVFSVDDLPIMYNGEDQLAIHIYTRGPIDSQELYDTFFIDIFIDRDYRNEFYSEFVGYPYEGHWNIDTNTGITWVTPERIWEWIYMKIEEIQKTKFEIFVNNDLRKKYDEYSESQWDGHGWTDFITFESFKAIISDLINKEP